MNIFYMPIIKKITMLDLLKLIFGVDPKLESASSHTDRIYHATIDGDPQWMLKCKPKIEKVLECEDGKTYRENE